MTHAELSRKTSDWTRQIAEIADVKVVRASAKRRIGEKVKRLKDKLAMAKMLNIPLRIDFGQIAFEKLRCFGRLDELSPEQFEVSSDFDFSDGSAAELAMRKFWKMLEDAKAFAKRTRADFSWEARDYIEHLDKTTQAVEEAVRSKLYAPKAFQESKTISVAGEVAVKEKVKKYPVKPEEGNSKMNNTKIFRDGRWQYVETRGEATAERAKQIQRENPALDFTECLVRAEKEALGKDERDGDEKHFGETSLQDFAERNPGVPPEAVQRLKDAKRGEAVKLSDGSSWMKVRMEGMDRILPMSTEGADEIVAFHDARNFEGRDPSRGHFIPPTKRVEKKRGFSSDGKFFVTSAGTTLPVEEGADENDLEVSLTSFIIKHDLVFRLLGVPSPLEKVARKAISVLWNGDLDPMEATADQVALAVKVAMARPEKYDAAMRYTESREFETFEKALAAALA